MVIHYELIRCEDRYRSSHSVCRIGKRTKYYLGEKSSIRNGAYLETDLLRLKRCLSQRTDTSSRWRLPPEVSWA